MDLPHCKNCGTPCLVDARYCRKCGMALYSQEELAELYPDDNGEGLEFDDLHDFETLEEVINDAVPENFKELTIERLRRHIIRSIWKQFMGIDPFPSTQELIEQEHKHKRQMQNYIERNEPPMLLLPRTKGSYEGINDLERQYHLVWINGMVRHLSLMPEEVEYIQAIVAQHYYHLEPCDCDKVKYIPSEINPNFLRKA